MAQLRGNERKSSLRERPFAILPGQYFDAETGLHQNWHRDYDPSIGRYLQSDPIGLAGGLSTYGYGGQRPTGNIDPQGLLFDEATFAARCAQVATATGTGTALAAFAVAGAAALIPSSTSVCADLPPPPDSNCPEDDKCKKLREEIRRIADDIARRHLNLVLDPLNLHALAFDQPNLGPGAGTYTGHAGLLKGRLIQLKRLIAQADAVPCWVDPADRHLLNLDPSVSPIPPWAP